MNFAVPANNRVKLKEIQKRDKHLDLARELEKIKLWSIKVTVIPIVISAFCIVIKELVQGRKDLEIRGLVETIQTTAILRLARILRRVLETLENLVPLRLQRK